MREKIILVCTECLSRNYTTSKKKAVSTQRKNGARKISLRFLPYVVNLSLAWRGQRRMGRVGSAIIMYSKIQGLNAARCCAEQCAKTQVLGARRL